MPVGPIPHDAVRAAGDRSWTGWLLDALRTAPPDERDEIAETLSQLADPRAVAPLTAILEDRSADGALREAAAQVLRSAGNPPPGAVLRAWWADGDAVLRRHALLGMGRAEADLVEPVASDPSHPHHRAAIATLTFGFDAPRFQALKIAALDHPDPEVREQAADALLWDEPAAAEAPLLRCASDPVPEVAVAAIDTLRYYPTRRTVEILAAIRGDEARPEAVRTRADDSIAEIAWEVASAFRCAEPAEAGILRTWLAPIRDALGLTDGDLAPTAAPAPPPPPGPAPAPPPLEALVATYTDPDGPWADRLATFPGRSAATHYAPDRERLVPFLIAHPDPQIRERAVPLLSALGERDALLELLRDPAFSVRKSAMYGLGLLPADAHLAEVAWAHLQRPDTASTHAYETLIAYVAHAPREEAVERLVALVTDDERETVRVHAVYSLRELGAADRIEGLLGLLRDPPAVTWALHLALLDAAQRLSLPLVGLDALSAVDHLHVREATARFEQGTG